MSAPGIDPRSLFNPEGLDERLPDRGPLQNPDSPAVRRAQEILARKAAGVSDRVATLFTDDGFEIHGDPDTYTEASDPPPAPRPRADDFDPDADEIDLEIDGRPRVVNLTRADGEAIRLEIPALTVDKLDRIDWYMSRYNNRSQEMLKQTDPAKADVFGAQRRRIQEDMILYVVPDFPRGLIATMTVKSWTRLNRIIQAMQAEAKAAGETEAAGDPNS